MKTDLKRWVGLLVLFVAEGILSSQCHAALTARGDIKLAQALLSRITAGRQKVSNFSCTVESLRADHITDDRATSVSRETTICNFAFDSAGRGRVELIYPGATDIHIWDGLRSVQYSNPDQPSSGDAIIRNEPQPETSLRGRPPWTLWGDKFCNFLRRAMSGRSHVTVKALDNDLYHIEAAYSDGGKGVAVVDGRIGYAVIRQEYHIAGKLRQTYWSRFKQVEPGLWFPAEGEHVRLYSTGTGASNEERTYTKITDITVNDPGFARHLSIELPFGTEVRDYSTARHYVAGCKSRYDLTDPQVDTAPQPGSRNLTLLAHTPWQGAFNAKYRLGSADSLKRIAPPFIPQRTDYMIGLRGPASGSDQVSMVWNWDEGLKPRMCWEGRFVPLHAIIQNMLGLDRSEFVGSPELLNIRLAGDWIVRKGAPVDSLLKALEQTVQDETSRNIRFVTKPVPAPAIIARGKCQIRPLSMATDRRIHIFADDPGQPQDDHTGTLAELLEYIADRFHRPVIDRTESSAAGLRWCGHDCVQLDAESLAAAERDRLLARVLANVAKQTGLAFSVETVPLDKWSVVELR